MPNLRSQLPPYILLTIGMITISCGCFFAYRGRAWTRFHGWVYRAKEPKWFWWQVALYFLCGVGVIGYFLYLVN